MRFRYLADRPVLAPTLARWHYEEWSDLLPGWSSAQALEELLTHQARAAIPTTVVALSGERLLGSASLLVDDMPEWRHLTPWLANLYVVPSDRGRGVGRALIARIVTVAERLGVAHLHVFTAGQEELYRRYGWGLLEHVDCHGRPAALMARDLAPRIPARTSHLSS